MINPVSIWRGFLARPNEDRVKVFGVAILTALVSAIFVSLTAVTLKPRQDAHLAAEQAARMAQMLDTLPGMRDVMEDVGVDALDTRIVELATGAFVSDIDPATFDADAAAADSAQSTAIPPEKDIAGLNQRANHAPVYLLERDGAALLIVLPVSGAGYQSKIKAMLALEPDLRTVASLTILEQGETPGIGARVEDAAWLAQWPGKQVANSNGEIMISIVRGGATEPFEVDGISGATVTSNGVANMLRYWLGDHGYGPFLARLSRERL